jgi:hypothetical protein
MIQYGAGAIARAYRKQPASMCRTALFVLAASVVVRSQTPASAPPEPVVPNFADTTIKTRVTHGLQPPKITTLHLKGARQRTETVASAASRREAAMSEIIECDKEIRVQLLALRKTYLLHSLAASPEMRQARRFQRPAGPNAAIVTVTTDSEDTGERRQMASYEARHIKTKITVKPSKGAQTPAGKTTVDGWYIDLPGLNCWSTDQGSSMPPVSAWQAPVGMGVHDKFVFKKKGNGMLGYAIEEVSKEKSEANVVIHKIELLEFSDRPLDASMFEVPPDYAQEVFGPFPRLQPGPTTETRPQR